MNEMNPAKESKKLICPTCEITAPDDSKHRGRFNRRHLRDNVCGNYALVQAEGRAKLAEELLQARVAERTKDAGSRVDMSGDAGADSQVDGGTLQGGVA